MTDIVEFIKAQMAVDEQLALATTPVPVPGSWRAAQDKHAADDAPLSLIQGRDEDEFHDPDNIGYSYGNPVIVHAADWQDEAEANLRHIERHDPASVLADVKAKRELLRHAAELREVAALTETWLLMDAAVGIERALVAAYAGRPGFKTEWSLP
ncbi:hypothetical protein Caci_2919 [Catenulispora acidiphila DSM 44928]|uniref:Uncharacterized protein n=1 Tax=Catenulispora acidiphila (strain DSM 44928 / JCM 14897 / NBRC 102108 / NRRL B-24433 / ID139908) TaxID=479433 RepID=C7Q2T6_CATAD|nr:DUF6221 family protein [Catenulispora acidiphila]ACU71828.1 hypothetical protein Caci_2919 [Catenulispora acidiphila DSM 44928]